MDSLALKKLKAEAFNNRKNFEDLKLAYNELAVERNKLTQQLQVAEHDREQMRRDQEVKLRDWQHALDQKMTEMDRLRMDSAQMDVEVLRHKFFAEFEQQIQSAYEPLEAEVDKWRTLYYELHRNNQEFRFTYEQQKQDYQATLEDVRALHQAEVTTLSHRIAEQNEQLAEMVSLTQRTRQLQHGNGQLQIKVQALTAELDNLQLTKIHDVQMLEQKVRHAQDQVRERDNQLVQLSAEQKQMKQVQAQHEEDSRAGALELEQVNVDRQQVKQELLKVQSQFESQAHQHQLSVADIQMAFAVERATMSKQQQTDRKAIAQLKNDVDDYKNQKSELVSQIESLKMQSVAQVRLAREEEWAKYQMLDQAKSDLQRQHDQLVVVHQESVNTLESECRNKDKEIEVIRYEMKQLHSRLQQVSSHAEKSANDNEHLREELTNLHKRCTGFEEQLLRAHLEKTQLQKVEESLRREMLKQHGENELIQQEFNAAQLTYQQESRKNQMAQEELRDATTTNMAKLEQQLRDTQTQNDVAQQKLTAMSSAVKKLKSGYTLKLDEALNDVESWKHELKCLEAENAALKKSVENENHMQQLRLREMLRKQDNFAKFLQSEGLSVVGDQNQPPAIAVQNQE